MEDEENINEETNLFLTNIKKEGDFKTPSKYFDRFPEQVQSKIKQRDFDWFQLPQYKIAFASICTVFIGLVVVLNLNKPVEVTSNYFTNEEINNYFEEHIDEYNVIEIIEEISLAELNDIQIEVKDTLEVNLEKESELINKLTEEEIMEYLIDEGYEDTEWDKL